MHEGHITLPIQLARAHTQTVIFCEAIASAAASCSIQWASYGYKLDGPADLWNLFRDAKLSEEKKMECTLVLFVSFPSSSSYSSSSSSFSLLDSRSTGVWLISRLAGAIHFRRCSFSTGKMTVQIFFFLNFILIGTYSVGPAGHSGIYTQQEA